MDLETIEPTDRGFAPRSEVIEPLMLVDAPIVTDFQGGRIDKTNATAIPKAVFEI